MTNWANRAQEPEKASPTYDERRAKLFPDRPLDETAPDDKTVRQIDTAVWGVLGWAAHHHWNTTHQGR